MILTCVTVLVFGIICGGICGLVGYYIGCDAGNSVGYTQRGMDDTSKTEKKKIKI